MRNNVEALEARVLLSAHGASAHDDVPGPHGVGLAHAAAPAQANAAKHAAAKSDSAGSDDQGQSNDPSESSDQGEDDGDTASPVLSGSPEEDSPNQLPEASPQILHSSPSDQAVSTSPSGGSAGGTVTVGIIYIDHLPAPGAGGLGSGQNNSPASNQGSTSDQTSTSDQSSSPSGGFDQSGWQTPAIVATRGNESTTLSWWSIPSIPTGGHIPGATGQGNISRDGDHGDDQYDNGQSEQGGGHAVPQILHADPPPQAAPAVAPAITHPPDQPATVNKPPPSPVPATTTDASSVSNTAPTVTPLALTPSRQATSSPFAGANTLPAMTVTAIVDSHSSAAPVSTKASGSEISAPAPNPFGQVAAIVSPVLSIVRTITANPPSVQAVVEHIKTAGAVAANVEAMTTEAIAGSAPAQIAYNFVQFDAGSFRDTISRFANELATLTTTTHSKASATRAWIITGTVLGLDAIFLGYCHGKARRQKKEKLALARISRDPKSGERIDD